MKAPSQLRWIAVACLGALASCAPPAAPPARMPVSASFRPQSSVSSRLYQEINAYRRGRGAVELQRHSGLDRLAQEHCEYLRKNRGASKPSGKLVSHYGFKGRALYARERYQMASISENVAAANHPGANPSTVIVGLWQDSKDHRKNMLDQWTHTGVGVVTDSDGTVFATQLFSTISSSQMSSRERLNGF